MELQAVFGIEEFLQVRRDWLPGDCGILLSQRLLRVVEVALCS